MNGYDEIDSYLESNLDQSIAELSRLVAQPSVGAQKLGMRECAALVCWDAKSARLRSSGYGYTRRAGCFRRTKRQI